MSRVSGAVVYPATARREADPEATAVTTAPAVAGSDTGVTQRAPDSTRPTRPAFRMKGEGRKNGPEEFAGTAGSVGQRGGVAAQLPDRRLHLPGGAGGVHQLAP